MVVRRLLRGDKEGVGVVPDIALAEADALLIAHRLALRQTLAALDVVGDTADTALCEEILTESRQGHGSIG